MENDLFLYILIWYVLILSVSHMREGEVQSHTVEIYVTQFYFHLSVRYFFILFFLLDDKPSG